jgi:AcrR family transcriptional regulator
MPTKNDLEIMAASASDTSLEEPSPIDGRRARGERNKNAVVTALLELYESGEVQPSAARVAALAGVSERSVFRYFDDMEDLATTAVSIQWERVQPFYKDLSAEGPFEERLQAIIDHRLSLYDKVSGVFRVGLAAAIRISAAAEAVEQRRDFLRRQGRKQFRPEIEAQVSPSNAAAIVDFTLSLENIDYLRRSAGMTNSQIKKALTENLNAVLTT